MAVVAPVGAPTRDDAVRLARTELEGPVDWGKELVLPMSNPQEALRHFTARVAATDVRRGVATNSGPDH